MQLTIRHLADSVLTRAFLYPRAQEGEEAETAEDREFIDDANLGANHSQGDAFLAEHVYDDLDDEDLEGLYVPGKCTNVIGYDPEEGDIVCGDACNPAEQFCHYCRTKGHRMTF